MTNSSNGRKWRVIAAFFSLGFTTSVMNALNSTAGSTQAYLPLMFAFIGGFVLTYAGFAKDNPELRWSILDLAAVAILGLCGGALLGVPAGIGVRVWGSRLLAEPTGAETSIAKPSSHSSPMDLSLHATRPCEVAARVLSEQHAWLATSARGQLVEAQYRRLLTSAGCESPE